MTHKIIDIPAHPDMWKPLSPTLESGEHYLLRKAPASMPKELLDKKDEEGNPS